MGACQVASHAPRWSEGPCGTEVSEAALSRPGQLGAGGGDCLSCHTADVSMEQAVCLVWSVAWPRGSTPEEEQLQQLLRELHEEILECVTLVGARILEDNAGSGLIRCGELPGAGMTPEDVAVRLGQLLCRWALSQEDLDIRLRVGVHTGKLTSFSLPSCGRPTYLGESVQVARALANDAERDCMVHLSKVAKNRLRVLSRLRMMLPRNKHPDEVESYYLDAAAEVVNPNAVRRDEEGGKRGPRRRTSLLALVSEDFQPGSGASVKDRDADAELVAGLDRMTVATSHTPKEAEVMSFRDFEHLLVTHGVDTTEFGKGDAKTLREFYNDVVIDQDSYLLVAGSTVERVKELVRISLRMRGDDSRQRELRIASQVRADGGIRRRNQKLAFVLKINEGENWKDAVAKCFEEKFGLSVLDQKTCFAEDWDSYTFKEERMASKTVPDIITIYKTHNVVVFIKDKGRKELACLGLPSGGDFATKRANGEHFWTWSLVDSNKEDELLSLLQSNGIDYSEFSPGAFAQLYDEVYETCQSTLEIIGEELVRKTRIIKVWVHADILAVDHILLTRSKMRAGRSEDHDKGRPPAMRIRQGMDWQEAVRLVLHERLGLEKSVQEMCVAIDVHSHTLSQEVGYSRSYPGLKSIYFIDEVSVHLTSMEESQLQLQLVGLPEGNDFAFSRREASHSQGESHLVITHWCWQAAKESGHLPKRKTRCITDLASDEAGRPPPAVRRRLPLPDCEMGGGASCCLAGQGTMLERLLRGKEPNWECARRAASRIRDPAYSCKDFYEDVTRAFPELELYLAGDMSSGRTGEDEYQRTMGALFSTFWLMRLHLDGAQCFCFGLGEDWKARTEPGPSDQEQQEWNRRQAFYEQTEWASLEGLLVSAGLLRAPVVPTTGTQRRRSWLEAARLAATNVTAQQHDEERTLAMLVLTAIHDIMKSVALLPTVSKRHGPFRGYQVGETINDHDAALGYILDFFPKMLPSFSKLPKVQQDSVKFTQSKMEYNMGWLVQAEAPPGCLLRRFREVVISGQASSKDLAFYFAHWFTDLAGAEPYPQEGCEKFVLKFPQRVLNQFLRSFFIVQNLSFSTNETNVLEDYLVWRWNEHLPSLGAAPTGRGSIARMRLVIMTQGDSKRVLSSFAALSHEDRTVLSEEMAYTGCKGQMYQREQPAAEKRDQGPAILVYYAPALMQKAGKEDPVGALMVLAEVYRQSRALWPLAAAAADDTVQVRIDLLKELDITQMLESDAEAVWVLTKQSIREAKVERVPVARLNSLEKAMHRVLTLRTLTVDRG